MSRREGLGGGGICRRPQNLRGRLIVGEAASFINCRTQELVECWIGSSRDRLKNAKSLQGTRSIRKTEPFGSKQLRVGKNNFELCNTDSPCHRVLPTRADITARKGGSRGPSPSSPPRLKGARKKRPRPFILPVTLFVPAPTTRGAHQGR